MAFRLAIDGVGAKHGGAATVLDAVLRAALDSHEVESIVAFCSSGALRRFDLPSDARLRTVEVPMAESGLGRIWWWRRGLANATRRYSADALLCLSGGGLSLGAVPLATLIQQALPFSVEGAYGCTWSQRARMAVIRREMRLSCERAAAVIVQTPTMKRWVEAAFRLPIGRTHVMEPIPCLPPSAEGGHQALAAMRASRAGNRILYVGTTSPHKNVPNVIDALKLMRVRHPDVTLFATVPATSAEAKADGVVALGHLSGPAMREAYELATVVVMPSLVETVGLPMLEAMSVGTCVAAADRPYAHDVCADAAEFFDPLDPVGIAATFEALLVDEPRRRHLSREGQKIVARRTAFAPYKKMVELVGELAGA